MNSSTTLSPQLAQKFAQLADYLGKAQKIALELSRSKARDYSRFVVDLTQPKEIPPEEAWFWSEEWQKGEREANKNLARDEVVSFDNIDDAFKWLDE